MILSGQDIAARVGILDPLVEPGRFHGTSYGLGYAGYDLRLDTVMRVDSEEGVTFSKYVMSPGEFLLGSSIERFDMPLDLLAIDHDKSTLARMGLSVFNTVIEPGWNGYLTLELVNKGPYPIHLRHGMGIAQVVFHLLSSPSRPYVGKYQGQEAGPQVARAS